MAALELSVLTPEGLVLQREVDEVTAPGAEGDFGVLPGHVPFISTLRPGVLAWRRGGDRGKVAVGPGFVEVDGKGVVVALAQQAVTGDKVDATEAERQLREAEAQLKKQGPEQTPEQQALREKQEWAQAQLAAR